MPGLFAGTTLERPVTCAVCELPLGECRCPRTAAGEVLMPSQQTAVLRLQKRGKGKSVTTVSGLDPVACNLPAMLVQFKSRCGAGGTIAGGVIEVQGDHREALAVALGAHGYKVVRR